MQHTRGRIVDVDSLDDLDRRLAAGARTLAGWRVRGLDLRGRGDALTAREVAGASFLGCTFDRGDPHRLTAAGALIWPALPAAPVDVYRGGLYTAGELFDAAPYAESLDGRAYAWSQGPFDPDRALAEALHDHAIDQALSAWRSGRRLVGVMGGHALERDHPDYAAAARLGRALAIGPQPLVVATGGGPGAMEAANLGARLAPAGEEALTQALERVARVPSFRPSVDAWVATAFEVCERDPLAPGESLGVPTWHYGHEPPNVFATAVAKYFRNAVRESILLEICDAGIVFLPGAGGTVQEIFQDGCENYYADEGTVAPMVLVGRAHWTERLPAWPLLRALARGRAMEGHVHLVDTVEEAAALVAGGPHLS